MKRANFARFYFLGDDDLLDIIGQAATKPWVIQNHLKKLFAGIHSVQFSPENRHIVAIESIEGNFYSIPILFDRFMLLTRLIT